MTTATLPDYTLPVESIPLVEPLELDDAERDFLKARIAEGLEQLGATLVAHYYVDGDIQDLAEATGGYVSESLEMARFGHDSPAETLVVSGVRFMGETSKILSPEKRVFMPTLEAECSLDLQRRHEYALLGRKNFRRFPHETNARDDQRMGGALVSEARHFQRVRHVTAGGFSEILNVAVDVIMRHQRRIQLRQAFGYARFQKIALFVVELEGLHQRDRFHWQGIVW